MSFAQLAWRLCFRCPSVWARDRVTQLTGPVTKWRGLKNSGHHHPSWKMSSIPCPLFIAPAIQECPDMTRPETAGFVSGCLTLKSSQPCHDGCFVIYKEPYNEYKVTDTGPEAYSQQATILDKRPSAPLQGVAPPSAIAREPTLAPGAAQGNQNHLIHRTEALWGHRANRLYA